MKNRLFTLGAAILVALITFSFTDVEGEKKEIKTDKSTITWKGYKVTGSHYGTVAIESGHLTFNDGKLVGGEFVADMSSIVTDDLTIKDITAPVTFDLSVYGNKATANVKIDRTAYDIRYGSTSFFDDLKDKAIYDEFDLVTDIEF